MAVVGAQARPAWKAGFWRLAERKIALASMSAIPLGACAAASAQEALSVGWLPLTPVGISALEVEERLR